MTSYKQEIFDVWKTPTAESSELSVADCYRIRDSSLIVRYFLWRPLNFVDNEERAESLNNAAKICDLSRIR